MPLSPGSRFGHYDITAPLGAGGMGEVYRATDTKLGRDVALKALPETFTGDPERLARFRREAQILASLNHPHIASIYGVEEIDGRSVLVLELVDGESLAARLRRGPMAVDEALVIGREIALALEAAHERAIVHRDLKPGNIALTADGVVKVLDFGLARATGTEGTPQSSPANSPTITSPLTLTALGVVLGTAAYMSPEQARGAVADRRSDVWAFGCVLYEMLTGRRAFGGDDVTETLAAVVKDHPDWTKLPPGVSAPIRALLEGCLEKDRRRRIGDIAVARFVLERGPSLVEPNRAPSPIRRLMPWAVAAAAVAAAIVAGWAVDRTVPSPAPVTRFTVPLPAGEALGFARRILAVSPDGTRIVFAASGRLFIRDLADFDAYPVGGVESALQPTFSPDGQALVFWDAGAIRRMAVTGGVAIPLYDVSPAPFSIDWDPSGIVVVAQGQGILRLSPTGGAPVILEPYSDVDGLAQGASLLPGGKTLLFTASQLLSQSNIWDAGRIVVRPVGPGERTTLIEGGSQPMYVPTGHILYMREGTLMAVPFDAATQEIAGAAVPVVEGVRRTAPAAGGEAQFAVSATGTLAYIPGPARTGLETVLVYGADGTAQSLPLPPGSYGYPRASPDGRWLAFEYHDGKQSSIAVYHLSGTTAMRRLTFGGNDRFPLWSADSQRVVFQSDREGDAGLFWQSLTGGAPERLTKAQAGQTHVAESWHPRENLMVFSIAERVRYTLSALRMDDRSVSPVSGITSMNFPTTAVFSPDGRWIAYQAGDGRTGEATMFVEPFPPSGTKYQIARGGRPLWSPDGKRLYFIPGPGRYMVTTVTGSPDGFAFTTPEPERRPFGLAPPGNPRTFDFLPDGRLVGINSPADGGAPAATHIRVVQNWFEELKARVPRPAR